MTGSYAKSKVWLTCRGCVMGIPFDEMAGYILTYNHSNIRRYFTFWEWLSNELEIDIHGYSILWNEGNPWVSRLPIIKGRVDHV